MTKYIRKRQGNLEKFDEDKITNAIARSGEDTGEFGMAEAIYLMYDVVIRSKDVEDLTVECVQDIVEQVLMESEYYETAKAYIIFRDRREQERKPDIFKKRLNLKPFEYPELLEYVDTIRKSYWVHTSYNYTSDIQDYRVGISDEERNAIKNAMLAISQVEVEVKTFWGNLYERMPKPEIASVGGTFSENEVRHYDAYSHVLEILGLNEEFERIKEIPALYNRIKYLSNGATLAKTGSDKDFTMAILLFSLFIEHVSLFSQFLIIMAFNKHRSQFKGISNVIEATSKEEQLHGMFGTDLINIIRKERPEWFDENTEEAVINACIEAYEAEEQVIDWIYEAGDLDFMPKRVVKEFVKNRLNNSLKGIGYKPIFKVDMELVEQTDWFDDEIIATKQVDFFVKHSVGYTKFARSVTADDLF